jgi:hypothetical protein
MHSSPVIDLKRLLEMVQTWFSGGLKVRLAKAHLITDATQQELIAYTYFKMRRGLGVAAILFPFALLGLQSLLHGAPLPGSVSGYYHTDLRTYWIGTLAVIAVFLWIYKGYDRWENRLLNIAGIGVLGVVLFPSGPDAGSLDGSKGFIWAPAHGLSALIAFGCMGYVAVRLSRITLELLPKDQKHLEPRFDYAYRTLGVLMVAAPLAALALTQGRGDYIFWAEAPAVVFFGIYWLVKTYEFHLTEADKRAVEGTLPEHLQNRMKTGSPGT